VVAAGELLLGTVVHEAADEEVEAAIVVVVEPRSAGGPAWSREAGFFSDIRESAVLIVLVEDALSIRSDEDVGPAVVVVVPYGNAHAESSAGHASFFSDIGERAVAIVLVERIAGGFSAGRRPEIAGTAVHEIDLLPTFVNKIQKRAAGAKGLRQVAFIGHGIFVSPLNATRRRRNFQEQRCFGGLVARKVAG